MQEFVGKHHPGNRRLAADHGQVERQQAVQTIEGVATGGPRAGDVFRQTIGDGVKDRLEHFVLAAAVPVKARGHDPDEGSDARDVESAQAVALDDGEGRLRDLFLPHLRFGLGCSHVARLVVNARSQYTRRWAVI
jgi:hypothetical protein